jgi:pimeloyl-ACP methyl ester carboxylesterase
VTVEPSTAHGIRDIVRCDPMSSRFARSLLGRALRPVLVEAGAGLDVAVVRLVQRLGPRRFEEPAARHSRLEAVAERYRATDPERFYAPPPPIEDLRVRRVRALEPVAEIVDLTWTSRWTCHDEAVRARWSQWHENSTAHVRLLRGRGPSPRPVLVCVHGYRAGAFAFEERAFAATWFHRLGLDVALFTLPFHALRAPRARTGAPLFPTGDAARNVEGFGQAIWDLRSLIGWLRAQGAPEVAAMGMSLGGYTVSLLATVEQELAFVCPFIPVADLTDVALEHEALRGQQVPDALVTAGKQAMELVRPLARRPLVPSERILVVAAEGDRITPRAHAEALAAHFGAELVAFPGAHLLQFGRRDAFAAIARRLAALGLVAPPGGARREGTGRAGAGRPR